MTEAIEQAAFVTTEDINEVTGANFTQEEADARNAETGAVAPTAPTKRPKKLQKSIEGTVVKITVLGAEGSTEMSFDTAELSDEIKAQLVPFGVSHKLGDSAAGREGNDAVEAINKVWEGLKSGDWSVRAPAAPKVSVANIKSALENMSEEEREQAKKLMAQMGITL